MAGRPVALVTGASRGIGAAIARELARSGHDLVVNYLRSVEAARGVVDQVEAEGGAAIACQADVGVADDRGRLLAATRDRFGRLDVLVNNAGITSPGRQDLLKVTESGWDAVFATNLKGPFFLAQQAAAWMVELIRQDATSRGTILNVSSISAYAASTNRADYCIAKSAMRMMTCLLADRLASERIFVYEICPGVIDTDMTAPVREKYDSLIADGLTPIRRWGTAQDVAKLASSLVGDVFSFSTGDRFNVDGGFHIRRL